MAFKEYSNFQWHIKNELHFSVAYREFTPPSSAAARSLWPACQGRPGRSAVALAEAGATALHAWLWNHGPVWFGITTMTHDF